MAHLYEAIEAIADPSIRHIVPVSGGKDSLHSPFTWHRPTRRFRASTYSATRTRSFPRPTTTWIGWRLYSVDESTALTHLTT